MSYRTILSAPSVILLRGPSSCALSISLFSNLISVAPASPIHLRTSSHSLLSHFISAKGKFECLVSNLKQFTSILIWWENCVVGGFASEPTNQNSIRKRWLRMHWEKPTSKRDTDWATTRLGFKSVRFSSNKWQNSNYNDGDDVADATDTIPSFHFIFRTQNEK